jgi:hypothetical protein
LAQANTRHVGVPDPVVRPEQGDDAFLLVQGVWVVDEAKIQARGVIRADRDVDAVAGQSNAERPGLGEIQG